MHLCPVEIAAFFASLPFLSWLWSCCKDCAKECRHVAVRREDRDWPESCWSTDGVVNHVCVACLETFSGYKARSLCRACVK